MNRGKQIIALLLATSLLTGCAPVEADSPAAREASAVPATQSTQPPVQKEVPAEGNLRDNDALYEGRDPYSVIDMYLTVSTGNEADSSNHTWEEVSTYSAYYYADLGVDRYKVEGILQIDDGNGLGEGSFGYGEVVPNVSVQVRGQTSSRSKIKNYKIRIKDGKGEYNGQRTLALNKHYSDPYRFLNKLSYDTLAKIPQLMAARTQFVHLYVKDSTGENAEEFVDYGIFTMVEQLNKTYLSNHGLDDRGHFYKINMFEWYPYEEIMAVGDDYDEGAFTWRLEIKGNDDHAKLRNVLKRIENYSIPITEIVEENFDAENICYWMAFNMLIGNYDTAARNVYIYSPLNSEKWYFIPWDLDASFRRNYFTFIGDYTEGESWENGLTQFVGLTIINRMMKEEKYRKMLDDAIHDLLSNQLSPESLVPRVAAYSAVVRDDLFNNPLSQHSSRITPEVYDDFLDRFPTEIEINYRNYLDSLKRPWPFYINLPEYADDGKTEIILSWGRAYDIHKENITYAYKLAWDSQFENLISEGNDLVIPSVNIPRLAPGEYYLRVTATNESGHTGDCFDYLAVSGKGKIYGCYRFFVMEDGTIALEEEEWV